MEPDAREPRDPGGKWSAGTGRVRSRVRNWVEASCPQMLVVGAMSAVVKPWLTAEGLSLVRCLEDGERGGCPKTPGAGG